LQFDQTGEALQAIFSYWDGSRYGRASLLWDPAYKAFRGPGRLTHYCGRKTIEVPFSVAIIAINQSTIRNGWLNPEKVNCRTGKVESSSAREMTWVVASPK
jgi:hypothetical protein